jgi:hypothetical protein
MAATMLLISRRAGVLANDSMIIPSARSILARHNSGTPALSGSRQIDRQPFGADSMWTGAAFTKHLDIDTCWAVKDVYKKEQTGDPSLY